MHLTIIRIARRILVRFVSASAVRIALGATLTTTQPAVALNPGIATRAQQSIVLMAGQGNDSAGGFAGPGTGWG